MKNVSPGSALEKEMKADRIILIVLAVVTVLVWMSWYVFDTDQRVFVRRAGWFPNVVGTILIVCSWVWLYVGVRRLWDGKAILGWILFLASGLAISSGLNMHYFNAW